MKEDYKNILVAVDIHEDTEAVIAKGAKLASFYNADIHIVHFIETAPGYTTSLDLNDVEGETRQKVHDQLIAMAEKHNVAAENVSVETAEAKHGILSMVKQQGIDLLIIETHKYNIAEKFSRMLGSTANEIEKDAPCDVLIIRGNR